MLLCVVGAVFFVLFCVCIVCVCVMCFVTVRNRNCEKSSTETFTSQQGVIECGVVILFCCFVFRVCIIP
jgi:hypothetical protein